MRRAMLCTSCGILTTCLFLSGLMWMTSLRERGWSKDRQTFGRQATFVFTLLAIVVGAIAVNHGLNRRRYRGAGERRFTNLRPASQRRTTLYGILW